jgi:hypothetical protein
MAQLESARRYERRTEYRNAVSTKRCSRCQEEKPTAEFHSRQTKRGRSLYAQCKACHRRYARQHYADNKTAYLTRVRARNVETKRVARESLADYLRANPCIDCREADLVVLQFDHCRGEKVAHISDMVRRGWSLLAIKKEIEKCDVVCANCHARRTASRAGRWSLAL